MSTYEGRLLNLDKIDKCNRKFAKDCKITFPDKIPVNYNFQSGVHKVLGSAEISKDDNGLLCKVSLTYDDFKGQEYYVAGYYRIFERYKEGDITIIDSCRLVSMSIVPDCDCCDIDMKMWKVEED